MAGNTFGKAGYFLNMMLRYKLTLIYDFSI